MNDRIAEPPPREDRRCVVCEEPVPPPTKYAPDTDAFCRTRCCRSYFGTQLAVDKDTVRSVLAQEISWS